MLRNTIASWGLVGILLIFFFGLQACSNGNTFTEAEETGSNDALQQQRTTSEPHTYADPPGGVYWWYPMVNIRSNLSSQSMIYYSKDGSDPVVGEGSTYFAYNPVRFLQLTESPQEIKYFAFSQDGFREDIKTDTYEIDPSLETKQFDFNTGWRELPYGAGEFKFPQVDGDIGSDYFQSWYLTGHLVGKDTNREYSFVLAYQMNLDPLNFFYYRQFHLIDITAQRVYPETELRFNPPFINEKLRLREGYMDLRYVHSKKGEDYIPPDDRSDTRRYTDVKEYGLDQDDPGYNEDRWRNKSSTLGGGNIPFEYELSVYSKENKGLELDLTVIKPPMLGEMNGYITYLNEPGARCYNYTLIKADGVITIPGMTEEVIGTAFMERVWNKSSMSVVDIMRFRKEWIALQLSTGHQMVIYRFYDTVTKKSVPSTTVTVMDPLGDVRVYRDFTLSAVDFKLIIDNPAYRLALTDQPYAVPNRYNFSLPDLDLKLTLNVPVDTAVSEFYTEEYQPFCRAKGTLDGEAVTGVGWMEITRTWPSSEAGY